MVPWMLILVLPPFIMCWWNLIYVAEEHASSGFERDVLCSCEFIKSDGARGHLLDVTDDCELIEEWISRGGCRLNSSEGIALLASIEERLRIPWIGGSKQLKRHHYSLILAPLLFLFGSICIGANILQVVLTAFIVGSLMLFQGSNRNRGILSNWLIVDHCLIFSVFIYEQILRFQIVSLFCSCISFSFMLYLHFSIKNTDPGIINPNIDDTATSLSLRRHEDDERPICEVCNIIRPERSKHCRVCNHCVKVFDHHCPVLDCCIGINNHNKFIIYLSVAILNAYIFIILSNSYLSDYSSVAVLRCIMWLFPTIILFLSQIYQISIGMTTNERMNRGHSNYDYLYKKKNDDSEYTSSCLVFNSVVNSGYNWKSFIHGRETKVSNHINSDYDE